MLNKTAPDKFDSSRGPFYIAAGNLGSKSTQLISVPSDNWIHTPLDLSQKS